MKAKNNSVVESLTLMTTGGGNATWGPDPKAAVQRMSWLEIRMAGEGSG